MAATATNAVIGHLGSACSVALNGGTIHRMWRKGVLYLLSVLTLLSACAEEQVRWAAPEDLVCNRDTDCQIVQGGIAECDAPFARDANVPYAMSRAAIKRHARNHDGCSVGGGPALLCDYDLREWAAVCSDHVCERRSAHFFSSPKIHCRSSLSIV